MANASFISLYNTSQTTGSEYRFKIYSYESSHLHKVVLKCGSYTKTWDRVEGGVETTYTVPLEWAKAMPNATSMTGTLTLTTYQSNYSTKIGSNDVKDVKFNIPSSIKPTVSLDLTEAVDGIAEQFGAYVQGRSKINVTVNASGMYDSTIKKYNTVINNVTYTSSSFTTGYIKATSTGESESRSCHTTVTDSRGRTDVESEIFVVYTYAKPKINMFTVERCLNDGTLNDEGTCVKIVSSATIDDVKEKNTKAFKLSYKLTTEDDWTEIELSNESYELTDERIISGFDVDNSYNFKIEATDFFETVSKVMNLETSGNIMDFLANGKGMAIGKAAELEDTLDVGYGAMNLPTSNYMGGNARTDDEKNLYFISTGEGVYTHDMKIYGGNGSSSYSLGVYDRTNGHRVVSYQQSLQKLNLDPNVILSGFKNIATISGNGDTTFTDTSLVELPTKHSVLLGSRLSINGDGQVVIGSGVSYVKICASIYAYNGFTDGDLVHCNIRKNNTIVYASMARISGSYLTISGAEKIISVTEGDVLKLCALNQTGGRGVISGNSNATYMTVEVVG